MINKKTLEDSKLTLKIPFSKIIDKATRQELEKVFSSDVNVNIAKTLGLNHFLFTKYSKISYDKNNLYYTTRYGVNNIEKIEETDGKVIIKLKYKNTETLKLEIQKIKLTIESKFPKYKLLGKLIKSEFLKNNGKLKAFIEKMLPYTYKGNLELSIEEYIEEILWEGNYFRGNF